MAEQHVAAEPRLAYLSQKRVVLFWVRTHENPADEPSRNMDVREAAEASDEMLSLIRPERTPSRMSTRGIGHLGHLVLEVFSGAGGLSAAMRSLGIPADIPMEAFPSSHVYVKEHDLSCPHLVCRLLLEKKNE